MFTQLANRLMPNAGNPGHNYTYPTTYSDTGTAAWTTPTAAYTPATPSDLTTAAVSTISLTSSGVKTAIIVWSGIPALATGYNYTTKTLYLNFSCTSYVDGQGNVNTMSVEYSTNGGSSFTDAHDIVGIETDTNYAIDITGLNETQVQVQFTGTVLSTGAGTESWTIKVFDIWIDGTHL